MAPAPLKLILDDSGAVRWYDPTDGRTAPLVRGADGDETPEQVQLPEDLSTLEADALKDARAAYGAEIERIKGLENPTADDAKRMAEVAAAYKALGEERDRRVAADQAVRDEIAAGATVLEADPVEPAEGDEPAGTPGEGDTPPAEGAPVETPAETPAPADGAPAAAEPAMANAGATPPAQRFPAVPRQPTLNRPMSLAEINAEATTAADREVLAANGMPQLPARVEAPELIMNAAEGIPGFQNGARVENIDALARAYMDAASNMGVGAGTFTKLPVASIRRSYGHDFEEMPDPRVLEAALAEMIDPVRNSRRGMEALVAAGGWCAPSEIRYDFFDVSAGPTLWDVPTVGINRGGLRWPISLSLAGFFAISGAPPSGTPSAATMPWEWTEADDIATITGSGAKLCLRPPCPDFDEARLRAFGICVINGNFADEAYPELVRHFLGLTNIAHQRVMNRRHIAQALALATQSVSPVVGDVGATTSAILGGHELLAEHERTKFGMPAGAVIEAVFPTWLRGNMRSDLTKRMGFNDLAVGDAYLMSLFDQRGIRAQFVSEFQTLPGSAGPANTIGAATAPTAWPGTVTSLVYAPGTYFLGRGLRIDQGLIRDSVLNAENDHTAAWTEEGTLVGRRGHEALNVTTTLCASGETGGQIPVTTCGV